MANRNPAAIPAETSDSGTRSRTGTAGDTAGIDIVGFPQLLYVRTFGDPDTLFVRLLEAAREAYGIVERLSGLGEDRAKAAKLSGMQLASSLLQSSIFSLAARGLAQEHVYTVDLNEGTLCVSTRLYSVVSRRTSFFRVEIAGKISEGQFVVRNPSLDLVIMQFEVERLKQPAFFSSWLAQECLRAQVDQERFKRMDETIGADAAGEVRLVVTIAGSKIPIALRQKEADGGWDIIDGRLQEWIGVLSPEMEKHLGTVTNFVKELFLHMKNSNSACWLRARAGRARSQRSRPALIRVKGHLYSQIDRRG